MNNLIGQSLGRYHILEQLGEGGMATVYKAFDTRLETDVAVKIIRTDRFTPEVLARALKRFEREAKALAKLTHSNIVKVMDYGEYEGQPYLVMPFLPGGNLKQYLRERGRIPWQEAVRLLLPIAQALEFAHGQGIIHRDVKPANILLTQSGQPTLTDFGVAKVVEEEGTMDLTGTAAAVGTPEYMAPEQTGKNIDHRVDIYALGVVFYEMVTGRRPFEADTPLAVLVKQASDPLPRPGQFVAGLPDAAEKVLLKALAKKPEDRYQTMGEFISALEKAISSSPSRAAVKEEGSASGRWKIAAEQAASSEGQVKRFAGKRRVLIALLATILGLAALLGIGFYGLGMLGTGPLSHLAKPSFTPTATFTHTPTHTLIPTITSTTMPTSTMKPSKTPAVVNTATTNFTVSATLTWQSTTISIQQGQKVVISIAGGKWTSWKGTNPYNTGEGWGYVCALAMPAANCVEPLPSFPAGGLIGRIGNQIFGIGTGTTITANQTGILSFRMNDGDDGLYDNDGSLNLSIVIK